MELADFLDRYSLELQTHEFGAKYLLLPNKNTASFNWELYHLSDYAVSSVSGPVYWLNRRELQVNV